MKRVNSDVAYDYIRKNIVSGKFPPGHSLLANDLALEIGVSRTPVKDALRQLETDGLVVIQTRLGAKVRTMDENEFRESCETRIALESYAAGLAARNRTRADLQEIESAAQSMTGITEEIKQSNGSSYHFAELLHGDVRFHIAILSAAKNEMIKSQILRLHLINRVISQPMALPSEGTEWVSRLNHTNQSHKIIHDAIKAGDEAAAKTAMEQHIQELIDDYAQFSKTPNSVVARKLTDEELNYMAVLPR